MLKILPDSSGVTNEGTKYMLGRLKLVIFDHYLTISQKQFKILWKASRNSCILYRMVLFPVILSDP